MNTDETKARNTEEERYENGWRNTELKVSHCWREIVEKGLNLFP